jgi:hypothetical protein
MYNKPNLAPPNRRRTVDLMIMNLAYIKMQFPGIPRGGIMKDAHEAIQFLFALCFS